MLADEDQPLRIVEPFGQRLLLRAVDDRDLAVAVGAELADFGDDDREDRAAVHFGVADGDRLGILQAVHQRRDDRHVDRRGRANRNEGDEQQENLIQ